MWVVLGAFSSHPKFFFLFAFYLFIYDCTRSSLLSLGVVWMGLGRVVLTLQKS